MWHAQFVVQDGKTPLRWKPPGTGRRRSARFAMTQTKNGIPHLLDCKDCWQQVSDEIRAATDIWIFLDFDGTLVSYYDRPEDVKLSDESRRVLLRLSRHRRVHLAIVSGRRNVALRRYVRVPRMKLLGLFGWEKSGRPPLPRGTKAALRGLGSMLGLLPAMFPGILVENKSISYAVHFRGAPPKTQGRVRAWVRRLVTRTQPDFAVIHSNHACEIVPHQVQGKGVAMREFTRDLPTPFLPIYVGDDLTDEPAFTALRKGITVRVGSVVPTKARFRLRNPEEVCTFLERVEEELS
jgi:trehalose 6-phosphate phosphatase